MTEFIESSWPAILLGACIGYVLRMCQTGAFKMLLPRKFDSTLPGRSRRWR